MFETAGGRKKGGKSADICKPPHESAWAHSFRKKKKKKKRKGGRKKVADGPWNSPPFLKEEEKVFYLIRGRRKKGKGLSVVRGAGIFKILAVT